MKGLNVYKVGYIKFVQSSIVIILIMDIKELVKLLKLVMESVDK